jgi:hypothetical protein
LDIEEDEDSEIEVVEQETGDDVIDESLMEEATIPVDDEITSELAITYDPVVPVIMVGTYFANMVEFRKAFVNIVSSESSTSSELETQGNGTRRGAD